MKALPSSRATAAPGITPQVERGPEGYLLTDLGSSFGTRLNGQPVTTALLHPLDRITVGDTVLVFESDGG